MKENQTKSKEVVRNMQGTQSKKKRTSCICYIDSKTLKLAYTALLEILLKRPLFSALRIFLKPVVLYSGWDKQELKENEEDMKGF